MKFEDIISIIQKTDKILKNACNLFATESVKSSKNLEQVKISMQMKEARLNSEFQKEIASIELNYNNLIDENEKYYNLITEIKEKLQINNKKFSNYFLNMSYAGISSVLEKKLLAELNRSSNSSNLSLSILNDYIKGISYPIIVKPAKGIFQPSKKNRCIYEKIITGILISEKLYKENEKKYELNKNTLISETTERFQAKVEELRKEKEKSIIITNQNNKEDSNFLITETNNILTNIYSKEFYEEYHQANVQFEEAYNNLKVSDDFLENIYIGDLIWLVNDNIYTNPVGKEFFQKNSNVYEDGIGYFPITLQLSNCYGIFLSPHSEKDIVDCITSMNKIMYSFFRQLPLGNLEVMVFDPENRGNSIYPFLNFLSLIPDVFSKKIFTSTEDIVYRINEINQYINSVIQQKLSNKFDNVFEYNNATPDNPLPIRLVMLFDFPKYIEQNYFDTLCSIIRNAKRCGIFICISYTGDKIEALTNNSTMNILIKKIKEECICLIQKSGFLTMEKYGVAMSLIDLPKQEYIDQYVIDYEKAYKAKLSRGIPFTTIVKEGEFFSKSSAEGLSLPIGKGDGSITQFIEFGKRSSQHAIITGATGSGKSTLLHTIIMSSIMNYSPDELNLYLMDFKSGTEFKIYERYKVPHIKLLALDALQEFGESILIELVEEQKRRSQLFKDNGEHTSLKSYVTATGKKMPRILVIMDEFQILFNESSNRKVAMHCSELANKIVTEGRAFGIHLVMATQTLRLIREKTTISNSTIEQMRIRIGLKCGEEDAAYIFGDANSRDAIQKMKGAIGTAVYNPEYTEAGNIGFRVAYCSENEQKTLLTHIQELCESKYLIDTKVFEGKKIPEFPQLLFDTYINSNMEAAVLEIGEPIRMDEPVRIAFTKKKNNNLLICGSDNDLMSRIVDIICFEIAFTKDVILHYIDGNSFFDEPIDNYIAQLIEKKDDIQNIVTRKDCIIAIEELYFEFKKRRKNTSKLTEKHIVVINGLQHMDILCSMLKGDYINREDYIESSEPFSDDFENASNEMIDYSASIKELIELGYSYGFYFIITCNDYQTIRDVLHYGAGVLNKFTNRIIFALSDRDSDELIEGIQVSQMNNVTAVFTDGIKRTLQFKPYTVPDADKIIIQEEVNS